MMQGDACDRTAVQATAVNQDCSTSCIWSTCESGKRFATATAAKQTARQPGKQRQQPYVTMGHDTMSHLALLAKLINVFSTETATRLNVTSLLGSALLDSGHPKPASESPSTTGKIISRQQKPQHKCAGTCTAETQLMSTS